MHPIERLRHLARSSGADPRDLVRETASALRGLGDDPAALVVACRRIVERHPTVGPIWWLCAHVLTSAEPYTTARRLADELDADPTPELLADSLAADARVCLIGWPDLAGEAVVTRGDVSVLAIDGHDQSGAFVRRLVRAGALAELIPAASLSSAVLAADLVLVDAFAASSGQLMAACGSRAAASVAFCSGVPVVGVVGRGRCLPDAAFDSMVELVTDVDAPWLAAADVLSLELCSHVVSPLGFEAIEYASLRPECPVAAELLRSGNQS